MQPTQMVVMYNDKSIFPLRLLYLLSFCPESVSYIFLALGNGTSSSVALSKIILCQMPTDIKSKTRKDS